MARSLGSGTFRHKPSPLDGMFYGKHPPGREPVEVSLRYSKHDGRLLRFRESDGPFLGFRLPRAAECRFVMDFAHRDTIRRCCVEYTTESGCRFRLGVNKDSQFLLLASERLRLDHDLQVAALRHLHAGIKAHNAVVQPIDNGPEDLVYLAETCYRVKAALADWQLDSDGPDFDELRAACNANTYAGHAAVEYFRNLNPQE